MNFMKFFVITCLAAFTFAACDDDDTVEAVSLNIENLQDVGPNYAYEGWIIVGGQPMSTGVFTVDSDGKPSKTSFAVDNDALAEATAFVLTIEPSPDTDPAPSNIHILAGDFNGKTASLTIDQERAIGEDFASASGSYILATPTNGMNTNERSGVWWLNPTDGPSAALDLPELPSGWKYEGWAVINGVPVTTGKFTMPAGADEFNGYSGMQASPPFPGEDFLVNAPSGVTFPTDLRGMTVVITVEPSPDTSPKPFMIKPLKASVPTSAVDHVSSLMTNQALATNPVGVVSR